MHLNQYITDKQNLEEKLELLIKKILGINGLVTTIVLNEKIGKFKNQLLNMSGLVTATVLNKKFGKAKNKIRDVSGLIKKLNYNAKISDIEDKYFTSSDYNNFTKEILDAMIKRKGIT